MITERSYRITCINERFPKLKNRKFVIYGTGINARLIIDHVGDKIDIIGLMDDSQTGRELYGLKVLSREEIIALHADTLIIAAKIDSAITVYKRIKDFCYNNKLDIFDLYGNHINDLLKSITEIENENGLLTYANINKAIDDSGIVTIDLKALFTYTQKENDIFWKVWEKDFHKGAKAFIELRRKIGEQQLTSLGSLDSIYEILKLYLCLSEEKKNSLKNSELALRRKYININENVAELISYIQEQNKKLFFINESILPGSFWECVLKDNGLKSDSYTLLNRSETGHNKYNGLYREIYDFEPGGKYLHIGNDYYADGIAASVYGFQSIVIKEIGDDWDTVENQENTIDHIWEYCTDNIQYSVGECKFDGFIKLNVCDKFYAIINKNAEIKPGWLEQLASTAENHGRASVICSRVINKDGKVLYAGELVTEDYVVQQEQIVSGFLPLYDYVHNTSQISLVSFLVRKDEWDKSENTALTLQDAFRTYMSFNDKVAVYQPLSEVIYTSLETEGKITVVDIDVVRLPKILVTDNLLTRFDHDAGSRTTWFYMKHFHKIGFEVTLMAQNFDEIQPYVMMMQQAGIRVIYGDYYRANWKTWLAEENNSFNYIYMQRPESTAFFLGEIREKCSNGKIFYFAHDLHFLRLFREYEITGNPASLRESEKSKEQECAIIETADVVHVVGSFEQEYLQKMYPQRKIRNIPLYIYNQGSSNQKIIYDVKRRKDLLYVGSFGHPPNLDAVVWFANHILPDIVKRYPEIIWHVVGANPPVDVQKCQGKNLVLHGFLSDDELKKMYDSCRIVVVPLRYGAGVKGKILEASYYQVPIVTTPIGAEGIPQDEKNMIVCSTAKELKNAVCNLYEDEELLLKMSDGGRRLIGKHYTETVVNEILSQDILEMKL